MKVQKHINTAAGGYWYRCSRVEFIGDKVKWELSQTSRYSFYEAYERTPHRQLIEARDDAALQNFVKAWGPLYFSYPWESEWGDSQPIEIYRNERDQLQATAQLIASVEEREMQRPALMQFLETLHKTSLDEIALFSVRQILQIPGDMQSGFDQSFRDWLEGATSNQIETATFAVVNSGILLWAPLTSPRFLVERVGRRNVLRAELGLTSLFDALNWMIWQDVVQKHPWQFCAECRKVFQPDTRHEKKFCSDECAHRKTAREWQQRKRKDERKRNGTQKTR